MYRHFVLTLQATVRGRMTVAIVLGVCTAAAPLDAAMPPSPPVTLATAPPAAPVGPPPAPLVTAPTAPLAAPPAPAPAALAPASATPLVHHFPPPQGGPAPIATGPVPVAAIPTPVLVPAPIPVPPPVPVPVPMPAAAPPVPPPAPMASFPDGGLVWETHLRRALTQTTLGDLDAFLAKARIPDGASALFGFAVINTGVIGTLEYLHELAWSTFGPDPQAMPVEMTFWKEVSHRAIYYAYWLGSGLATVGDVVLFEGITFADRVVEAAWMVLPGLVQLPVTGFGPGPERRRVEVAEQASAGDHGTE